VSFILGAHNFETHFSTESAAPRKDARFPRTHEDTGGPANTQTAAPEGPAPFNPMNPSADGSAAFPKNLRLLKRSEFRKVYEEGERRTGQLAAVFYCPNGLGRTRLGITVSARVGNAVVRNRIKRRVREVFRRALAPSGSGPAAIPAGWDVVLNPRVAAAAVPFSTLTRELARLFPSSVSGRTGSPRRDEPVGRRGKESESR